MSTRLWIVLILAVGTVGCITPEVRQACDRCRQLGTVATNTPVNEIEARFNLPKPTQTRAPATIDPVWRFIYYADGFVVGFAAQQVRGEFPIPGPADSRDFVYLGDMWIQQGVSPKLNVQPEPEEVIRRAEEQEKSANPTPDGIRRPADGSPKPSL